MFLKMSRNNILSFAALVVFAVATILVGNADAATIAVGANLGWRIPTDPATYDTFASQNTFTVGDVLVFNFPTGQHDVAPVTKEAYDACNATAAISLITVGPASVTLSSAGTHYYICTFGQHCLAGQKLAVNVTASSSSPIPSPPLITPSPTSAPPSPLPNTPSPSSIPPSEGPSPSGSASPPSNGPSPSSYSPSEGPSPTPSEGPSPTPSEGPSPNSATPSPGSSSAPGSQPGDADGSAPPPPSSASKTSAATIFVGMFISATVGLMF